MEHNSIQDVDDWYDRDARDVSTDESLASTDMVNQPYEQVLDEQRTSADPQKEAGFFSLLTFWWMNGVFETGAKRPLEESDFLPLQKEDETKRFTEKILETWSCEKHKCATKLKKKPRLWKSVLRAISFRQYGALLFVGVVESVCRVLQPLLLGFLVSEIISKQDVDTLYWCLGATAMFLNAVVKSLAMHQVSYRTLVLGMQLRAALKGVVYLKVLRVGQQTLRDFTTGQVVDLISNDVQRMDEAPRALLRIWLSILDIIVSACLIWYFIGWQALVGLAFFAVFVLFSGFLAYISGRLREKTAEVTDRRVLLMNEIVSAIRAVKTNAWEWIYREKIGEIRRQELNVILKKNAVLSTLGGLLFTSNAVAVFVSVIIMVQTGRQLTPVNIFMLIALMNFLRVSISYYIGFGLQFVIEAMTSLARIQRFLLLRTLPHLSETPYKKDSWHSKPAGVGMCEAISAGVTRHKSKDFIESSTLILDKTTSSEEDRTRGACALLDATLRSENGRYILRNISFEASQGSLVVLTGPVGSGKSSVLAAINKEVEITEGTISCSGTIAYVSQTPWVFPGTIRENVLFGKDYEEERFRTVVQISALERDLCMFPAGDQTIVGEHGAVLSGGQQARVSLARAVYADADVYLLDDPLSAVDAKVGQYIFEKCICDFLSGKTRLLVTHQTNHMKMADQIVALSKGDVIAIGKYEELRKTGILDTLRDIHQKSTSQPKKRQSSGHGDDKMAALNNVERGLEVPEEDRSIGTVSLKLYWKYFRAGLPTMVIFGLAIMFVLTQGLLVSLDVWLSGMVTEPTLQQKSETNMAVYTGLICGTLLFSMLRAFLFYQASLRSSGQLHDRMIQAILKAPVLFFDTNPRGRILNRFSKDVGCMDEVLPTCFLTSIQFIMVLVATTLLPSVLNPWMLLVVVPTYVSYFCIVRYYLKSSRELKRLESICRSPVFSHVSETLNGLDTIRSRGRQKDFVRQFYRYQDKHNQVFQMGLASVRWMGVRVDILSSLFIGAVAFFAIIISKDAARVGLSLVYVIETIYLAQFTVQQTSDVENQMTSVERVMTYTDIEPEPGYDIDVKLPEDWPRDASIAFDNVSLRYYSGGPKVLRGVNIDIDGNAKIGVAGRTGSGKSSIIAALLRMPEAKGDITVDGINLATLNLQESRRCVSVLNQTPFLLSDSLRKNLDPLTHYEDADLWRVLEDVQLKTLVEHLEGHLDYQVSEGGGNFSVGERQLLCLARVLLERNKVLILDEPTAHVDPTTERTIQNTVRDQLKECTVITVAHRLNTIRDCDKILVMKDGTAVEFDNYEELMKKESGVFAEMAEKQS